MNHSGRVTTKATYKLDELAREAGTSPRTVRYYVQRGLLPPPAFKGKDTAYGPEHLARLRAIRRLQDAFFPLDAIAAELERLGADGVEKLADGGELPRGAANGAAVGQMPAPDPSSLATTVGRIPVRVLRRFELAPGVELSIAEDAAPDAIALAEEILRTLGTSRERQGA